MKKGDVGTILLFTVKDQDGTVVDLTNCTEAKLNMKLGSTVSTKTLSIDSPKTAGKVRYTTIANDISTSGTLEMEIKLTFSTSIFTSSRIRHTVEPTLG